MADDAWADMLQADAHVQAKAQQRYKLSSNSKSGTISAILGQANKEQNNRSKNTKSRPRKQQLKPGFQIAASATCQTGAPTPSRAERSERDEDVDSSAIAAAACNPNNNNNTDTDTVATSSSSSDARPMIVCVEDLVILRRDVNLIDDPTPGKRMRALKRLDTALSSLFAQKTEPTPATAAVLQAALDLMLKPLLKRFADPSEKCRSLAITLLTAFFSNVCDVGTCLPYLFPAVMDRCSSSFEFDLENGVVIDDRVAYEAKMRGRAVGEASARTEFTHHVHEPSEELRLQLCELMHTVVHSLTSRGLHSMLGPYLGDVVLLFHSCARDPFPKLKTRAFLALGELAADERLCAVVHLFCPALVRSLMPALRHRHSTVRAGCIRCIQSLVLCPYKDKYRGGGSEAISDLVGYREANVIPINAFYGGEVRINFFGSLVTDHSPLVRAAVFDTIGVWLTTLLDRWDHAPRLLPFLLTALTDPCDEIVQAALTVLERCGQQYEEEHPDRIVEKVQYGVDGGAVNMLNHHAPLPYPWDKPTGSTAATAAAVAAGPGSRTGDAASSSAGGSSSRTVSYRPKLGTRLYVREHCGRFIRPVLAELKDWRGDTKDHAVKLLRVCLVYMEEHVVMEAHLLMRAIVDLQADASIADDVLECARVAGRFILPAVWLGFLEPIIAGEDSTFGVEGSRTARRAHALRALAAFIAAAKPRTVMTQVYTRVAALVSNWELTAESLESTSVLQPAHAECLAGLLASANAFFQQGNGAGSNDLQYTASGRLQSLTQSNSALYRTGLILAAHASVVSADSSSLSKVESGESAAGRAYRGQTSDGSEHNTRHLLIALGRFRSNDDGHDDDDACIAHAHERFLPELVAFVGRDGVIHSSVGAVCEAWRAIQVALMQGGARVLRTLLPDVMRAARAVFELPCTSAQQQGQIVDAHEADHPVPARSLGAIVELRAVVCTCLTKVCLDSNLTSSTAVAVVSEAHDGAMEERVGVATILELVFEQVAVRDLLDAVAKPSDEESDTTANKNGVHKSRSQWGALVVAMVRLVRAARVVLDGGESGSGRDDVEGGKGGDDVEQRSIAIELPDDNNEGGATTTCQMGLWQRIHNIVTLNVAGSYGVDHQLGKWVERQLIAQ